MDKKELARLALSERRAGRNPNSILSAAVGLEIDPGSVDRSLALPELFGVDLEKASRELGDNTGVLTGWKRRIARAGAAVEEGMMNSVVQHYMELRSRGLGADAARAQTEKRWDEFFLLNFNTVIGMQETYGG